MNRIEGAGVSVHLHKLIYKFQEDLENLVFDTRQQDEMSRGRGAHLEILGEAEVLQMFEIGGSSKKGGQKKGTKIAGSRVSEGEIDSFNKYRIMRNN